MGNGLPGWENNKIKVSETPKCERRFLGMDRQTSPAEQEGERKTMTADWWFVTFLHTHCTVLHQASGLYPSQSQYAHRKGMSLSTVPVPWHSSKSTLINCSSDM